MKSEEFMKLPKYIQAECFKRGIQLEDILTIIQNVDSVIFTWFGASIIFREEEKRR